MWEPTVKTRPVAAVRPASPYAHVVAAMAADGVSAVPMVDVTGRLLGIVSEVEPTPGRPLARLARRMRNRAATALSSLDLIVAAAPTVAADAPVGDVVRKLAEPGVRRLFVVDRRGALVGVVCRSDVRVGA